MEVGEKGTPELEQRVIFFPRAEPSPAGAGAPVFFGQGTPGCAGPKNPEDALKTLAVIGTRTSAFRIALDNGEMDTNALPLFIGESASVCHARSLAWRMRF
jgi:hypothetical protein